MRPPQAKRDPLAAFDYWVYVPDWGVAIAAPPKCASRSVLITIVRHFYPSATYETVRPTEYRQKNTHYRYMTKKSVDENWKKVAFVRDPIDRFASLWSHHCRDGTPGIPRNMRFRTSMDQLFRVVTGKLLENPHWAPQSYTIGDQQNIRFVNLSNAVNGWRDFMPPFVPPLDHVNKTTAPAPVPDYIKDRIKTVYKKDFELLEKAH